MKLPAPLPPEVVEELKRAANKERDGSRSQHFTILNLINAHDAAVAADAGRGDVGDSAADVARAAVAGLADYADNMRAMPNERAGRLLKSVLDYIDSSAGEVARMRRAHNGEVCVDTMEENERLRAQLHDAERAMELACHHFRDASARLERVVAYAERAAAGPAGIGPRWDEVLRLARG